jgi:hypothetical protein
VSASRVRQLELGVSAARAELEAKGVAFVGVTFDSGVCHLATFRAPDGNELVLHHRDAPYKS